MLLEKAPRTQLMWLQVSKEQEQKEVNGLKEQSSDKKVPVLTISLCPGKDKRTCLPLSCWFAERPQKPGLAPLPRAESSQICC